MDDGQIWRTERRIALVQTKQIRRNKTKRKNHTCVIYNVGMLEACFSSLWTNSTLTVVIVQEDGIYFQIRIREFSGR